MKRIYCLISIILLASTVQSIAENTNQIYKEELTISDDKNTLLAAIDVYGKVTLTENANYEDVINQLCQKIIINNIKINQLNNVISKANERVIFTLKKVSEIEQAWLPPKPKPEPKVEAKPEPKKKRKKFLGIF